MSASEAQVRRDLAAANAKLAATERERDVLRQKLHKWQHSHEMLRIDLREKGMDAGGAIAQLTEENEALNGKLTAAILGNQEEVNRLTEDRDALLALVEKQREALLKCSLASFRHPDETAAIANDAMSLTPPAALAERRAHLRKVAAALEEIELLGNYTGENISPIRLAGVKKRAIAALTILRALAGQERP